MKLSSAALRNVAALSFPSISLRHLSGLVAGEGDGLRAFDGADLRAIAHVQLDLVLEAQPALDDAPGPMTMRGM